MRAGESLTISRTIRADPARVFEAWTDPDQLVRWWGPRGVICTVAEVDLRVGGRYRLANKQPDGHTIWITGTYQRIEPPRILEYTWTSEPVTEHSHHSLVEVTFAEAFEGTEVTISHTQIANTEIREMHDQGWVGCLDGLDQLLATR